MKANLALLPRDGDWYYWTESLGGWWCNASNDPAVDQYCWANGLILRDEPVIIDNTYYGARENLTWVDLGTSPKTVDAAVSASI